MRLSVKPLLDSDMTEAAALSASVFRFAYAAAYDDADGFDLFVRTTFAPDRFAVDMRRDSIECMGGWADGKLAGVLKLADTPTPDSVASSRAVELAKLYVGEDYHGSGLASRMLDASVETARSRDFHSVWLCVWERNHRAQGFYRKAGFEVVGELDIPMNDVPFHDLVMRMPLK